MDIVRHVIREYLPCNLSRVMLNILDDISSVNEIRIRPGGPIICVCDGRDFFVSKDSKVTTNHNNVLVATKDDVLDVLNKICANSIYAYMNTIRSGFITVQGGHRVGIVGRMVIENNRIKNIKDISSINFRIARQIKGIGRKVIKYIIRNGNDVYNTLIISPPAYGKTTLLRDILRIISDGSVKLNIKGMKVSIIDERSEIAALHNGIPQNDVGIRSDVLDGCSKCEGMMLALRTMSPHVVATDEVGSKEDFDAISEMTRCGVRVIATMHGFDVMDIRKRSLEADTFERFVVLGEVGKISKVLDSNSNDIWIREDEQHVV